MNQEFQAALDSVMLSFRQWSVSRDFSSCRLVQYSGPDLIGAINVPLNEIDNQILELHCEGFYVDWAQSSTYLFVRVWEHGGPEPKWQDVFAETPILTYR